MSEISEQAMDVAKMIYETHKIESMTMPCLGFQTDEYVENLALYVQNAIDSATADLQKRLRDIRNLLRECRDHVKDGNLSRRIDEELNDVPKGVE